MEATTNSAILAKGVTTAIAKTINAAYFITYNLSGAIVCSNKTSTSRKIQKFNYTIKYTEPCALFILMTGRVKNGRLDRPRSQTARNKTRETSNRTLRLIFAAKLV